MTDAVHDLTSETVTEAVLAQLAAAPDARMRTVLSAAVRHAHEFAREVQLTPAEWLAAIRFLTEVGHACTPIRQEFILLSDVFGLSALVEIMHNEAAAQGDGAQGTQGSLLGPFFREGAPVLPAGACIVKDHGAPEIVVWGRVTDVAGAPLAGATVGVWQTDEHGLYDLQVAGGADMDMRGTFRTDEQGRYHFRTVRPIGYSIPMDGPVGQLVHAQGRHGFRPAHIHVLIGAPGHRELVTALYFGDDAHIASDTVFGVSRSLVVGIAENDPAAPIQGIGSVRYDFSLAKASGDGNGRVGADPAAFVKAAE